MVHQVYKHTLHGNHHLKIKVIARKFGKPAGVLTINSCHSTSILLCVISFMNSKQLPENIIAKEVIIKVRMPKAPTAPLIWYYCYLEDMETTSLFSIKSSVAIC